MKSNVINVSKDQDNLNKILIETQKTAVYGELSSKQTLRMQLIAEELIGLLKELSGNFEGVFWVEKQDLDFKFVTQIVINENMDKQTKRKFINVSTDKKNASTKSVMGKIRDVVENMLYPENAMFSSNFIAYQLETAVLLDDEWTLKRYKDSQKNSEESWDELEKSIIANLADDVSVAVKGNKVEIIITKNFNKEN
jgi:hypothetical protein